jgi:uncharacterized protein
MDVQQPNADTTNWAMFAHLSALAGFIIPFGNILGPLIIWLTKGKEIEFVGTEAKEALNFQITVFFIAIVGWVLVFVLIGFLVLALLALADVILVVLAAISASKGEPYRYPFTLRLVK